MPKVMFSEAYLAELRELLEYNPDTGVFTRKDGRNRVRSLKDPAKTARTYKQINANGVIHSAHTLAWWFMTGAPVPEGMEVDHKNRDRRDTRWDNLRLRNRSGNASNLTRRSNNTSGVTGVMWNINDQKWTAEIVVQGVRHGLGGHREYRDAVQARLDAELKYLGEIVSTYAQGDLEPPKLPASALRDKKPDERLTAAYARRIATRTVPRSKPGAPGIVFLPTGRFQARHRNKVIASFDTLEEAIAAREEAMRKHYGEVE